VVRLRTCGIDGVPTLSGELHTQIDIIERDREMLLVKAADRIELAPLDA
jgi:hypothetical protein